MVNFLITFAACAAALIVVIVLHELRQRARGYIRVVKQDAQGRTIATYHVYAKNVNGFFDGQTDLVTRGALRFESNVLHVNEVAQSKEINQ